MAVSNNQYPGHLMNKVSNFAHFGSILSAHYCHEVLGDPTLNAHYVRSKIVERAALFVPSFGLVPRVERRNEHTGFLIGGSGTEGIK